MQIHRFILGSKSPYRKALLEDAGLASLTMESQVDEMAIVKETPLLTALARAQAKGFDVAQRCVPGDLVLGTDQVLGFKGAVFDKSTTEVEARGRLKELQGQTHILHSAMSLFLVPEKTDLTGPVMIKSMCIDTPMKMRPLGDDEIEAYLKTGEWQGCVGCYKYEKQGIQLFEFSGDHAGEPIDQSAIVGLPLRPLFEILRLIGVNPLVSPRGPWTYQQLL